MKYKYLVQTEKGIFYSNSRNARKHLFENNVRSVSVYENNGFPETLICKAIRQTGIDIILVGAMRKEK